MRIPKALFSIRFADERYDCITVHNPEEEKVWGLALKMAETLARIHQTQLVVLARRA